MTRPQRDERGSTLVEILVATTLVVVVLSIATSAVVSGQRTARETVGRVQSADTARTAVAELSRTLRTAVKAGSATAVEVAEPARVVLYAHDRPVPPAPAGTGPTRTTYRVDAAAGTLVEERVTTSTWNATTQTWSYTAPVVTRVVARGLTVPQPAAVFRYHASVDVPCLRSGSCAALPLSGAGLSAADRARVRAVSIALSVRTPEIRSGSSSTVRTFVLLPNGEEAVSG